MRCFKRTVTLGLAGALILASPVNSMAETEKPKDMDQAVWDRLQDNLLEYDEIRDLVEHYNPTYRQIADKIEASAQTYKDAAQELRNYADMMADDAKEVKDDNPFLYKAFQGAADGYRKGAKQYDKAVDSIHNRSRNSLRQVRDMTSSGVQMAMIGYYQAQASREMLDTLVELSQAAYDSSVTQQTLGMATATDVQAAEKSLQAARGQLQSLDDTMTNVRHQICNMTGWTYDADVQLGEIPQPDLARIETMNPENDLTKAIGNNFTLIEHRSISGKGDANRNAKFRLIDETEAKVKIELETLYQAILEGRTAYEAAGTAFQSAQITMNGNDLKYQMGMLGRLEYLQAKMAYLQQKAAYRTAALNLTQDMENYDWAVEGLADVN